MLNTTGVGSYKYEVEVVASKPLKIIAIVIRISIIQLTSKELFIIIMLAIAKTMDRII